MNNESRDGIVSVVITAAGKGTRMGMSQNKQYIDILGKPVLARTITAFESCDKIDEIILTVNEADIDYCKSCIINKYGFRKVKAAVVGSDTRQRSVYNGLKRVSEGCTIVLIHDGARPFIDTACIEKCISEARLNGASCAAVPVKDTIKQTDTDGFVDKTVDRSSLWSIQTPQTFEYALIMQAHERAEKDGFTGTDDAMLAERLGRRVKLVMGSYYNIKITTGEDIAIAEAICRVMEQE